MQEGKAAGIAKVLIAGGPVNTRQSVSNAGMGIVVDSRHVLTCVQVVNTALGLPEDSTTQPDGKIPIVFPIPEIDRT